MLLFVNVLYGIYCMYYVVHLPIVFGIVFKERLEDIIIRLNGHQYEKDYFRIITI